MSNQPQTDPLVDALAPAYAAMADRIWDTPELRYAEAHSVAEQIALMREAGFTVTERVAGIPTAFMAEWGAGGPLIAFLGEFDALAGLSQAAGVAVKTPLIEGGNGHGCGHNLLGAGAMLAATALRDHLRESGRPGRVRYYGCPAEEGGSGKTFMARAGAFEGVDASFSWHPSSFNAVSPGRSLANVQVYYRFHGRASHAAASPELGRSALDAVELTSVGVQYMREHMPEKARVHSAITRTGGISPNVVQDHAEVLYLIRSPEPADAMALFERVTKIARGAAMMTETEVTFEVDRACSSLLPNRVLDRVMQAELERLGSAGFDAEDHRFAAAIRQTLTPQDVGAAYRMFGLDAPADAPILHEGTLPLVPETLVMPGSTDVGDVSWQMPLTQCVAATCAVGTPFHTWQLVAQGKSPMAHRGMIHAAKAMAGAAERLLDDPALLAEARAEFAARTAARPYVSPLPDDVVPPPLRRKAAE
ncbi:MAG: amidohydrolase [Rhodobacter sp.]|nr:amidohydrolase [Paracoccaceae bacterium]MCB1409697.1 amidohydrolase [Paracoccaceae bacterium]MCC0079489.1 amidohydrolase [Rhodobacter sp.]